MSKPRWSLAASIVSALSLSLSIALACSYCSSLFFFVRCVRWQWSAILCTPPSGKQLKSSRPRLAEHFRGSFHLVWFARAILERWYYSALENGIHCRIGTLQARAFSNIYRENRYRISFRREKAANILTGNTTTYEIFFKRNNSKIWPMNQKD